MTLRIRCGSRKVGGSCVGLRARSSRIIIDIGMPLVKPEGSEFDMREYAELFGSELFEKEILPRVEDLYEWQTPAWTEFCFPYGPLRVQRPRTSARSPVCER